MNDTVGFYVRLLSDPEVRNRIDTVEKCEEIIDHMEEEIDHGEMPRCYDWIVAKRNRLRASEGAPCSQ